MESDETQPPTGTNWLLLAICVVAALLFVQDGLQFLDRVLKLEERNQVTVELLTPSGQVGESITVNSHFVEREFRVLKIKQDHPRRETEWKGSYRIVWPEDEPVRLSDVDKRKLWKAFWTFLAICFVLSNHSPRLYFPSPRSSVG